MTRPPPHERPTAQELAAGKTAPMQIAGKPADVCPYCGAGMFVKRTYGLETRTLRREKCRNPNCGKKFITRQPQKEFVREVLPDDEESSSVHPSLTLHRDAG